MFAANCPSVAHPRACGENGSAIRRPDRACGSSPRMRGKQEEDPQGGTARRLIPAHAGKTDSPAMTLPCNSAHPRACGENGQQAKFNLEGLGSSPRMRGKLWRDETKLGGDEAHPRACGENVLERMDSLEQAGSSPRMRGKLLGGANVGHFRGLIPAHAGKTGNY